MYFPVSGVECPLWIPVVVAFGIALVTAPAGISGAFLLLPFQMSVLGFTSAAVTPTNLIYNIVAIPGGLFEYTRERRMAWPLAWCFVAGTLPGVVAGAIIRIRFLPDPRAAKLFVGVVLLYIGSRLIRDVVRGGQRDAVEKGRGTRASAGWIEYEFAGRAYSFKPAVVFFLALIAGVVGGIYGVGGGAMIAPVVVTLFHLPASTIAGAALFGTLLTSMAGVASFEFIGRTTLAAGVFVQPDWKLGFLLGVGGLFGGYLGARLQKHVPEKWIKLLLGFLVTALAATYIGQFSRSGAVR